VGAELEGNHSDVLVHDASIRDWRNLYRQRLHASTSFNPAVIAFDAAVLRARLCSDTTPLESWDPPSSCPERIKKRWSSQATYADGTAEVPSGMQKVDAFHMNMPDGHRFAVGCPGMSAYYGGVVKNLVGDDGWVDDWALMCVPIRLALGHNDPFVHPLLVVEPPCLEAKALELFRDEVTMASFQILRSPAISFASPFLLALLARERTSGFTVLLPASRCGPDAPDELPAIGVVVQSRVVEACFLRPETIKCTALLASEISRLAEKCDAQDLLHAVALSQRGSGMRQILIQNDSGESISTSDSETHPPKLRASLAITSKELEAELQRSCHNACKTVAVFPEMVDDVLKGGVVFASLATFRRELCTFRP